VKFIRDLLAEDGSISCMRLMCLMSMGAGIVLAFMGKDTSVLVFVGAAMGGKVAQKHVEMNGSKVETEVNK
jgi:hypothetical protein